jgi:hypothetical protein
MTVLGKVRFCHYSNQPSSALNLAQILQNMDFTCVETQIGNGDPADCEILELDKSKEVFKIEIPGF